MTTEPTVTIEPVEGAVTIAEGEAAANAVTLIAVDVVELPLLSVTRAVSEKLPADAGVQLVV